MKSKINLLLIVIGLFVTVSAFTQKDAKAKELLDKTSAVLNQSGGLSANFTININNDANQIKQSFEGQLFLKENKFFFDTPEQAAYFDGKTQWVYNKNMEEVSILEPQPQDVQTLNPASVLSLYKKDCNYKYKGEKTDIKKRKVKEISLYPKNKDDITQIDIQINPADSMPVYFRIVYKNNMEFRIYINKYRTNLNLPDSQFVFDTKKYPNAEVNDLR